MSRLPVPGAVLNYEVWAPENVPANDSTSSKTQWLTVINGHTRPHNDFRLLGKHMTAAGVRVLALDNRGSGDTELTDEFTLEDMANDVVALWDALGIVKTSVLGISMGGFIAQKLAVGHSARISRLILVSTAAGPTFIHHDGLPWAADVASVEKKLAPYFTPEFVERNKMLVQSMAKQIAKGVSDGAFAQRSDMQRRAMVGFDMTGRLKEIKSSTVIIHGVEDQIIPVAAGEALARGIPGAKLERLAGAGHLLLAEKPQDLYRLVKEYIK